MTLVHWSTVAFAAALATSATALGSQNLDHCPGVKTAHWPSLLVQCNDEESVKKCMEDSFDAQYSFCRSCQIVDGKNLDDANNCLCIQCALNTLESKCYQEFCSKGKNSNHILSQLARDSNSYGPITNFEFDSSLNFSEVNYFVDSEDSNKIYRNLLPREKKNLIDVVIKKLKKDDVNANAEGMDGIEALWRKKKKTPPSTETKTVIVPLPEPEKPGPEPDDNCGCDDDCDYDGDSGCMEPKPEPPWIPDFDKTVTTTETATDVILEYETIYKPIRQITTTTAYETIWWPTTLTKYKNDIVTKTETEIEEFTKYIKVGEVTKTKTVEPDTKTKTKTVDSTITQIVVNPTSRAIKTEVTTVTHHNRHHRRKTWTRRIRHPHHSTAVMTVIRNHEPAFGLFNIPDDPAPLLASKRIVKSENNSSNFTTTTAGRSNISSSNYGYGGRPKNTGTSSSRSVNVTLGTDIRISAAPQAATAMIVYTTLVVSLATSMMLAFSYGTDLNSANSLSEEGMSRTLADEEEDDDDENNNSWLDAEDIELTDQVSKGELSHSGLVQKIR